MGGIILALSLVTSSAPAFAKKKNSEILASPPREIVNPYGEALRCLSTQLSPEQKNTMIGVHYFVDRTGKEVYSANDASGKFMGQGSEDMLMNDLRETGMSVVEINPAYRALLDWQGPKLPRQDEAGNKLSLLNDFPALIVSGSFSTFDFGSSKVNEFSLLGIGGGSRVYSARYSLDARISTAPVSGSSMPGARVVTSISLVKDVVGREKKAGLAAFFGSALYANVNINSQQRELMQYSQRYMISRTAYGLVAKLWKVTACEDWVKYGDDIIAGEVEVAPSLDKK